VSRNGLVRNIINAGGLLDIQSIARRLSIPIKEVRTSVTCLLTIGHVQADKQGHRINGKSYELTPRGRAYLRDEQR
jgi:hypothetical protein